jgi:putative ABC transport system ATP-binding protein
MRPTHRQWSAYLREVADAAKAELVSGTVTGLEVAGDDRWEVTLAAGDAIAADGVVITGSGPAITVPGQPRDHPRVLDGQTYWLAAHTMPRVRTDLANVRATSIGFIFQTFNLIPTLSAQENVETALAPLRVTGADRRTRAAQALAGVGLAERLNHLPSELSGGQQQRVAMPRALVKEPKVLLADEPTGNLDETTRDEIIALLETLWRERGLTLVLVTHDSTIVRRAQRLGVMAKGKLSIKQDTRNAPQTR